MQASQCWPGGGNPSSDAQVSFLAAVQVEVVYWPLCRVQVGFPRLAHCQCSHLQKRGLLLSCKKLTPPAYMFQAPQVMLVKELAAQLPQCHLLTLSRGDKTSSLHSSWLLRFLMLKMCWTTSLGSCGTTVDCLALARRPISN